MLVASSKVVFLIVIEFWKVVMHNIKGNKRNSQSVTLLPILAQQLKLE